MTWKAVASRAKFEAAAKGTALLHTCGVQKKGMRCQHSGAANILIQKKTFMSTPNQKPSDPRG